VDLRKNLKNIHYEPEKGSRHENSFRETRAGNQVNVVEAADTRRFILEFDSFSSFSSGSSQEIS
jgi:hypothetical protein